MCWQRSFLLLLVILCWLSAVLAGSETANVNIQVVSVVVPCYNHGSTLRRALDSIVISAQHFQDWWSKEQSPAGGHPMRVEIVIVDDDSNDTTAEVAASFLAEPGLGVKRAVVQHRPEGSGDGGVDRGGGGGGGSEQVGLGRRRRPGAARNEGVRRCEGHVILFLDADDVYKPQHIQRAVQPLTVNASIGYVKTRMQFEVPMHPRWGQVIEQVSPINGAVRRDVHELVGGFPDLDNAEDASYWNMVRALSVGVEPQPGDTPTCVYMLTPGNHLHSQQDKFAHAPEDRDRFEPPQTGAAAEARRTAEREALTSIRRRIEARLALRDSMPAWLEASTALNHVGLMFKAITEWDLAMQSYAAATRANPNNGLAHYNMGVLFGQAGQQEEATRAYQTATSVQPGYAPAWYNLGVMHRDAGRAAQAEASYRAAVSAQPSHALASNGLATLLWAQGQTEEAEVVFREALVHHPEDATLLNNLGGMYAKMGKLQPAIAYFNLAIQADPDHPQAKANLGAAQARSREL